MNQKNRKIIYLFFIALFFIAATYFVVSAQGFVIDFKNFKFVKTGGLFLKFAPSDSELRINGKPRLTKRALINRGVFIKNLPPGFYEVEITRAGFENWQKNLKVEPGKVAAASEIKLWPISPEAEKIKGEVSDFWLSGKGVIYKDLKGTVKFNEYELGKNEILLSDKESNSVVAKKEENYFWIDLNNQPSGININELFNSLKQRQLSLPGVVSPQEIFLHPFSGSKIMILTKTAFYSLDVKKARLEQLFLFPTSTAPLVALSKNEAFLLNNEEKNLTAVNLILKTKTPFPLNIPFFIKSAKVNPAGTKIFLTDEKKNLLFFDRQTGKSEKITEKADDFSLSPEEKRLAILNENGVRIFYLADYESDTKELKGTEKTVLLPETGKISAFSWIPELRNHFLLLSGGKLIICETDSRAPLNFKILETGVKKFVLDGKEIYFLKENGELLKTELNF